MAPYAGYSAQIWSTVYNCVAYYQGALENARTPASVASLTEALLNSILNANDAIIADAYASAWQSEAIAMTQISALPLSIAAPDVVFFTNRLNCYDAAWPALRAIVPVGPFSPPQASIAQGNPCVANVGLLEFYAAFNYETAPVGLIGSNFYSNAASCATAMSNVAAALAVYQGLYPNSLEDVAARISYAATEASYLCNSFTSGPPVADVTTTNAWNQIVALPALTIDGSILNSGPYSTALQQSAVIRYALITLGAQLSLFLMNLSTPSTQQMNVATLRNGETLMDLAARALGDYTKWTEIATLNGLQPPYVGSTVAAGIAAYGQQILLPTPGVTKSSTGAIPSYSQDFLGTDHYTGPINGSFPNWTGDFQIITGYQNLAWALGRRLQTTLTRLIYHPAYGSRIPPEIGQIQDQATASHISAYGISALLSDPRVHAVIAAASVLRQQSVDFQGQVQPIGIGAPSLLVNEVITSAAGGGNNGP